MLYCVCMNPQDYHFGIYELTISTRKKPTPHEPCHHTDTEESQFRTTPLMGVPLAFKGESILPIVMAAHRGGEWQI